MPTPEKTRPAPSPEPVSGTAPTTLAAPGALPREAAPVRARRRPESRAALRDRFGLTVPTRYSLVLATDPAEVRAAQALRYAVFAGELAAPLGDGGQLDTDPLDPYCDHILVRDDRTGQAVGTYRMLPPERAALAGRGYSEAEFDLTSLTPLRDRLVELGRSCVHPHHRSGAVIGLMWAGIYRYMVLTGHRWVAGCASIPLAGDAGATAAGVWDRVRAHHLSPPEYRVRPHTPWPDTAVVRPRRLRMPPLLRGYLRLGAWVCGPPAHDTLWNVADLFVLLGVDRIHPRYQRHFLGGEISGPGPDPATPEGDRT